MSTKIWEAYKVPISKLNEFTDIFHDSHIESAMDFICNLVDGLKDELITNLTDEEKKNREMLFNYYEDKLSDQKYMRLAKFGWIMMKAADQAKLPSREFFQLDCGFNFWINEDYAYVIPIVNLLQKPKIKYPEWVLDYHYQNSTDRDGNISEEEWSRREAMWKKLNCGQKKDRADHNSRRYYHKVIDMESSNNDAMDLRNMFVEREKQKHGNGC